MPSLFSVSSSDEVMTTSTVLHLSEHEFSVSFRRGSVLLHVANLHTSNVFESAIDSAELEKILPVGFPSALCDIKGFYTFMTNVIAKEAGEKVEAKAGSAHLSCKGTEKGDTYNVDRSCAHIGKQHVRESSFSFPPAHPQGMHDC